MGFRQIRSSGFIKAPLVGSHIYRLWYFGVYTGVNSEISLNPKPYTLNPDGA